MQVLLAGLALNIAGLAQPLLWVLPALVAIPVCAAPLWLTPAHFFIGSALFYAGAFALLPGELHPHDVGAVMGMWIAAIGVPTSIVFHFAFYRNGSPQIVPAWELPNCKNVPIMQISVRIRNSSQRG